MAKLIKATDLLTLTRCDREVFLDHHGDPDRQVPPAPYQVRLQQQGRGFEAEVTAGMDRVEPAYPPGSLEEGFEATLGLMRRGVQAVAHGVLIGGGMVGMPDLLERASGPSRLGAYFYRPVDIKLASEAKPGHRLQVMAYAAMLEEIQGVRPDGSLYLRVPPERRAMEGLYTEEIVPFDDNLFRENLGAVRQLAGGFEPRPFYSGLCRECAWQAVCIPIVEQARDVSLITNLRRKVWEELHRRGLGTLDRAAGATVDELVSIRGVGDKTARGILSQARALSENRAIQVGSPGLPPPAPVELFFDVESLPAEGLYYLMGLLVREGRREVYVYDLAESVEQEGRAWEAFLSRIDAYGGPVYHYGAYERTALSALTARYGDDPRAQRLLDRMVDLQKAVKGSVTLPVLGYSLKDVAQWLGYSWTGETQAADDSMLDYLNWLETQDRRCLENILRYNEDDVRATRVVCDWLRGLPAFA